MENIEITAKVNGKEVLLSTISMETLKKIRARQQLPNIKGIGLVEKYFDVIKFVTAHPTVGHSKSAEMEFIERSAGIFLKILLPEANANWTFAVFDYAKAFCAATRETYTFPVHRVWMSHRYLYIKIQT